MLVLTGSISKCVNWWGLRTWVLLLLMQGRHIKVKRIRVHLDGAEVYLLYRKKKSPAMEKVLEGKGREESAQPLRITCILQVSPC